MQVLGRLFDYVLTQRDQRVTIVGATSGDTGSAAIEACAGRDRVDIMILHPQGRTSEVQRRQMTTVLAPNVGNIAIEGTFDDCQDMVKALFADAPFPHRDAAVGGELDQLGADRGADPVLRGGGAGAGRAGPGSGVQRADRQFRQCAGGVGGAADGAAGGAADRRIEPQRYSGPVPGRRTTCRWCRWSRRCHRAWTSRSVRISSGCCSNCWIAIRRRRARRCWRSAQTGRMTVADPLWHRARGVFHGFRLDDPGTAGGDPAAAGGNRISGRPAHRHRGRGGSGAAVCRRACRRWRWPPPIRRSSPMRWNRRPDTRPALPPRMADLFQREERFTVLPNDLGAVEAAVRALVGRNTGG